eukprot:jgi/Psemu1/288025/fgenesh1_pg.230_\
MSQTSSRKQRKRPQRLSWPAALSQESVIAGQDGRQTITQNQTGASLVNNNNGRKRARQSSDRSTTAEKTEDRNADVEMWIEKFAPKSSSDLCVAPKKIKEIKAWIQNSKTSMTAASHQVRQKLLILVGSPGIGKSTAIRMIADELKFSTLSWNESFHPRGYQDGSSRDLFSVEQTSALDSFDEFLQQSGSGIESLHLISSDNNNNTTNNNSIVLLEDLPNLYRTSAEERFRNIMARHLHRSHVPTILIFSDVSEGKHRPEDLERLIDPNNLYDNEKTTILQIHPVTKPKMKKVLTEIAKREKCRFGTDFLDEIHEQSRGDVRHAIMTLQLHATGRSKNKYGAIDLDARGKNQRDTKLSTFHSLGKLLYAKREVNSDGISRLAFDPEAILEQSDLGVEGSLRFLEFHSVDFFTDIIELSNAFSSFSDVADMLGHATSRRSNSHENENIFPYGCASSIAGRTVGNTNIHPAPNRFRQFSRPKVFDILRNGKQNQILVDQLSRRLSTTGCHSSLTAKFVTESLPYVRQIAPQDVDPYLDNLYSVAIQRHKERKNMVAENAEDDEDVALQKEQEKLLEMDDIEEYDSN